MKKILTILGILFSIGLMLYSVIVIFYFPRNLGSYVPAILGLGLITLLLSAQKLHSFTQHGFGRFCKYFVFSCFAFGTISFTLFLLQIHLASQFEPEPNTQAIIVLGAGLRGENVSLTLASRLDKALEYHNNNPHSLLIVSGGQGADEVISEADAMERYLVKKGADPQKILKEDQSTSTKENFAFSKALLDNHFTNDYTTIYVTNDFHIFRAGLYAKKTGLSGEGLASDTLPYMKPSYFTREYLALLWYFAYDSWQ